MRRFARFVVLATGLAAPAIAAAQQWKPIGTTTRDTTKVLVKTTSIKRGGDTVTALLLMRFPSPQTSEHLRAMTKLVTFNCMSEKMLVRESVMYTDFDRNRVFQRQKSKQPGWGAVFSPSYVMAYANLCSKSK